MAYDDVLVDQPLWPESVKQTNIPEVIERFFQYADDPTHAGSVGFAECFAPTGELTARSYVCKGRDGKTRGIDLSATSCKHSSH